MCDRELLPCPFCGKLPDRVTAGARDNRVQCLTQFCPMKNKVVSRCDWNRRAPGKRRSGRLLDGEEWNEVPDASL